MNKKRKEEEIMADLQNLSDIIKKHEFKKTGENQNDYFGKLIELSYLFSDLANGCSDISSEKRKIIEDANLELANDFLKTLEVSGEFEGSERKKFIMSSYERTFQIIYGFLETGNVDFFYDMEPEEQELEM